VSGQHPAESLRPTRVGPSSGFLVVRSRTRQLSEPIGARQPAPPRQPASTGFPKTHTDRASSACVMLAGQRILSCRDNTAIRTRTLHSCTPALTSALVHAKLPRITQRHEDFQRSRSEATNHWPPFPLARGAVRSDWDHRKSEANGFLENPRTLVRLTELAGAD
jgi:hypothetical protein